MHWNPMAYSSGKQCHPSAFAKNGRPFTPWNSCAPVEDFLLCQIGRIECLVDFLHAHEALACSRYGKDRIARAAF